MLCICFVVLLNLWSRGFSFPGQNTPPVFDLKREWLISENEPVGSRITTVRTKDDDHDPIEYGIEPAVFLDGSIYFKINKKTGEVFLNRPLTGLAGNDYYLFITANDGHQIAKIEVYARISPPNADKSKAATENPSNSGQSSPDRIRHRPHSPLHGPHLGIFPEFPNKPRFHPSSKFPTLHSMNDNNIITNVSLPFLPSTVLPSSSISLNLTTESTSDSFGNTSFEVETEKKGVEWMSTIFPVVATVAFAPVIAIILWLLHRKCKTDSKLNAEKKLTDRKESNLSDDLNGNPHLSVLYLQRARIANSNRYESRESLGPVPENRKWDFPRHHLRFLGMLGEGCFGHVWKCEALNINNTEGTSLVAVKTLKENASEEEKKDLMSEMEVMKLLDPHPNVVTLLGCCIDRDPIFLIMEYVHNGKLQSYLRESRAERFYGNLYGSSRRLTSRDLTAFAYQIARGMEYISSKGIIHRDLAARNVLIDDNKTCKVADFGFARDIIMNHVYERKSEGRLPIRWMAPESLYDNIFTTKTDVWSFGIVMWEIVTLGSTPYPGVTAADVMRKVKEGYRLEKPEHCKREMYNIMFYCWDKEPNRRPHFSELVQLMDKLLISENDYIELDRFPDHSYYNITSHSGEKL